MPYRDAKARHQNDRDYQTHRRMKRQLDKDDVDKKVVYPIRISQAVLGRVTRLVHEGLAGKRACKWKTPAEALRELIVLGLKSMKGQHDTIDEMLPYLQMQAQFDGIKSQRQEATAALNRAIIEIQELLNIKAKNEALQYYHVTMDTLQQMSRTVWTDWCIAEMKRKFRDFDKQLPPGVQLERRALGSAPGVRLVERRTKGQTL